MPGKVQAVTYLLGTRPQGKSVSASITYVRT